MTLVARRARPADAFLFFQWRNDPVTVRWSTTRRSVSAPEHARWFAKVITDETRALMLVEDRSVVPAAAVGTYRLDGLDGDSATVSVTVAPEHRGRRLARQIIALAAEHALRAGALVVYASIRSPNTRSQRAFASVGFEAAGAASLGFIEMSIRASGIAGRRCALCMRGVPHHTNSRSSIGRAEDRFIVYDQHEVEDGVGGYLIRECDAGDLWLAWEKARGHAAKRLALTQRYDVQIHGGGEAQGLSAGSTPAASTTAAERGEADAD